MSSSQSGSVCVSGKSLCTTKLKSHEAFYSWTIENFDFHEAIDEELTSSTFSSISNDKYNWYLLLRPNEEESPKEKEISLFLELTFTENLQPVFGKFTIDFLNQDQKVYSKSSFVREFTSTSDSWGFYKIPKKDILFDNTLNICVNVTFSVKNDTSSTYDDQFKLEFPKCDVIENLASLLENRDLADFVISVGEKEYPVHKCILAARSPVFAAMFKHDTKENQQNRVNIEDVDENVMDEMLRYIYTGKCDNLDPLAEGLLAVADKYALDRLKVFCSRKLQETLMVENAANILLLSEMHHADELKKEAIRFIVDKPKEVFGTEGWKYIKLSNCLLIDEVCQAMALRYTSH